MSNSQIVYNRYIGKWMPSGTMSVDAPDMATAIRLMTIKRGSEPINVTTLETNVYVTATVPSATFTTECHAEDVAGEIVGNVYPASSTVPIGNTVYLNAVPNEGFSFVNFTDEQGKILSTDPEYRFILVEDIKIIANFEKEEIDPTDISIDPTISKLLKVNRDDGNYTNSQYNQDHITLDQSLVDGIVRVKITGEIEDLKSFASTAGMGIAKWVGIVIDTNESYKTTDIYYNGSVLPPQEFIDANNLGIIGDGAFILWLKAEEIAVAPKMINVYTSEKQKKLYIQFSFIPAN